MSEDFRDFSNYYLPTLGDFIRILLVDGEFATLEFTRKKGNERASRAVTRLLGSLHRSLDSRSSSHTET